MRNIHLAAALALAGFALLTLPRAAEAEVYPYCAAGEPLGGTCSYATLEQCRAYLRSLEGFCRPNPNYHPTENALARQRPSRR
jgi:hypothetical protein